VKLPKKHAGIGLMGMRQEILSLLKFGNYESLYFMQCHLGIAG